MYAPSEHENTHQFIKLAELFSKQGVGVPNVYAFDLDRGFVLMEDLGDDLLEKAYAHGGSSRALDLALRTLVDIQSIQDCEGTLPTYEENRFHMELGIFSEWFLQGLIETSPPAWYPQLCRHLVNNAMNQPRCAVHRDFHCRNLLIKPSGELGVVDFQDALIGPITYDLASLLGDCYHEFDAQQVARSIETYRAIALRSKLPSIRDEKEFRMRFDLMVIQRQLKALGIFSRLWLKRGRHSHLADIKPVLARLATRCERYPQTLPLAGAIRSEFLPRAASRLEAIPA